MELDKLTAGQLLALSRAVLAELRRRGVIRTGNAPTGDFAELLVQRATGGELAPNSQRGWDVLTADGEKLQVKARIVPETGSGKRQLSPFRTWGFDAAVIVLFNDDFSVKRAAHISVEILQATGRFSPHVNGQLIVATDELLDKGEDWTERLRAAVEGG